LSGAHSRRKGAEFERAMVRVFREALPGTEVRRGFQYRSGKEAADLEVPILWIETKRHRRVNLRAALRQVIESAPPDRIPVVIAKDDRAEPVAALPLRHFVTLYWALTVVCRGDQSRTGKEAPDVVPPILSIETKHGRRVNLRAALMQVIESAPPDRIPVVIAKDDRAEPVVVLQLQHFLVMYRAFQEAVRK